MDRIFRVPFLFPQHTKEIIVLLLMYENPLKVKQIWNRVKQDKKVSYKTVYKAVNDLHCVGVVSKNGLGYCLNLEWIKCLRLFTENVELLYNKKAESMLEKEARQQAHVQGFSTGLGAVPD